MTNEIDYKKTLDEIQKIIHKDLKTDGFIKKGRTHNKTLDNGLIQVINFQMGQYQFENVQEIPGLRANMYGKFTVNMGVFVPELYEQIFNPKPKKFILEYDCEIRTRLSQLMYREDRWFEINTDFKNTSDLIIDGLNTYGKSWFERFDNRKRIVAELTTAEKNEFSPRQKMCGAIIELNLDRKNAEKIFNEYYDTVDSEKPHKKYVSELAKKLNIKLTNKTSA